MTAMAHHLPADVDQLHAQAGPRPCLQRLDIARADGERRVMPPRTNLLSREEERVAVCAFSAQ